MNGPLGSWVRGRVLRGIGIYSVVRGVAIPGFRYLFALYVLSLGYHTADLGIIASLAAVICASLLPLAGYFTDRGYALHVGVMSGLLIAASLIIPVAWPSYVCLVLAYALSNAGILMWQPSRSYMMTRLIDPKVLGRYFGAYMLLFNIARAATPFTLGVLLQWIAYSELMLWLGLIVFVGAMVFATIVSPAYTELNSVHGVNPDSSPNREGHPADSMMKQLFSAYKGTFAVNGKLLPLMVFGIIDKFGYLLWLPMLNAFLKEVVGFDDGEVGLYNSLRGSVMLISSLPAGYLTDRLGAIRTLILNEFLSAIGALMIVSRLDVVIYASSIIFGWSFSSWLTSYNKITALILGPENVGRVRAGIDSARTYTSIPAPSIGSMLFSTVGTAAPFIAGAAFMIAATTPLFTWRRSLIKSGQDPYEVRSS